MVCQSLVPSIVFCIGHFKVLLRNFSFVRQEQNIRVNALILIIIGQTESGCLILVYSLYVEP